jgi:hypothetical protein
MPIVVRDMGSFHIGGHSVTVSGLPPRRLVLTKGMGVRAFSADGEFETEQMYVQYVRLEAPRARQPLLLSTGCGFLVGVASGASKGC